MNVGNDKTDKDSLMKFGKNLQGAREAAGLSQKQLAAQCNTEAADIGRIELGKINPTFFTILDLSRGLGIAPAVLFNEIV